MSASQRWSADSPAVRSRWGHAVAAGLVLVIGLAVTLSASRHEAAVLAEASAEQFAADVRTVTDQTRLHLARYDELAMGYQEVYRAAPVDTAHFGHDLSQRALRGAYPGFEAVLVHRGARPDVLRPDHVEPHARAQGTPAALAGHSDALRDALQTAAVTGEPVTTGPLATGTRGPVYFVVYAPLFAAAAAPAENTLRAPAVEGWIGIVVRADLFFSEALARTAHGVGIEVFDGSPEHGQRIAARPRDFTATAESSPLIALPAAGRLWTLRMEPLPDGPATPGKVLVSGLLLSIVLALLVWSLAGSKNRALRLVDVMTADLRRNEQLFRSLAASSPLGIFNIAADGHCEYVNDRLCELTGRSRQELKGRGLTEAFHPADRSALAKAVTRQGDRSSALRLRMVLPDGTLRWVKTHAAPLRDDHDELSGWVGSVEDVTGEVQAHVASQQLAAELAHQARHDHLTGLANRSHFTEQVEELLADDDVQGVAVLFFDIDRFKVVNDSLGHDAGDKLLVCVGDRLRTAVREGDVAARFGGDEFVVGLPNVADEETATQAAERLMEALHHTMSLDGHEIRVTVSIGIALSGPECDANELLTRADTAMYRAKSLGKARFSLYNAGATPRVTGSALESEQMLRSAITSGELRLHFQPIVSVATRAIAGVEALVRWEHPDRGLLGPAEFIPLAEDSGLIVPLGEWVLDTACAQLAGWEPLFGPDEHFSVTVNVSARQLADPRFPATAAAIITKHRVDPDSICLEITESALVADLDLAQEALRQLRAIGVRIAVDDFGTGYSSLTHLKMLPIDMLKVDQSFVRDLGINADNTAIVRAVVSLSRALGLATVAEGVEEADQLHWLASLGCDMAQGFYFSTPQPPEMVTTMLVSGPQWLADPAPLRPIIR